MYCVCQMFKWKIRFGTFSNTCLFVSSYMWILHVYKYHASPWLSLLIMEVLVESMVMPLPSQQPWATLCEQQVGTASSHPHTLSGMLPGTQSYCHCLGSFHTRTRYIFPWLSHSRSGPSTYHRGPHHEAGSTRHRWIAGQVVVVVVCAAQGEGTERERQ